MLVVAGVGLDRLLWARNYGRRYGREAGPQPSGLARGGHVHFGRLDSAAQAFDREKMPVVHPLHGRTMVLMRVGPDSLPGSDETPSVLTTAEYIRKLRGSAGLSTREVADRAGVNVDWLERFESGELADSPSYDLLLKLVAATQPPRPAWWDSGHEHDLNLPADAVRDKEKHQSYWAKIEAVRDANRSVRRS